MARVDLDRRRGQFLLGVLVGLVAGFGLVLGILGAIAAVVLCLAVGFALPRFAGLSGALIGLGGEWLLLSLNSALSCSKTEDSCGQANFVPIVAVALAILGAGLFFGAVTWSSRFGRTGQL